MFLWEALYPTKEVKEKIFINHCNILVISINTDQELQKCGDEIKINFVVYLSF